MSDIKANPNRISLVRGDLPEPAALAAAHHDATDTFRRMLLVDRAHEFPWVAAI